MVAPEEVEVVRFPVDLARRTASVGSGPAGLGDGERLLVLVVEGVSCRFLRVVWRWAAVYVMALPPDDELGALRKWDTPFSGIDGSGARVDPWRL